MGHYVRKGLIEMVLGTDMAKHAKLVTKLEGFLNKNVDGRTPNDKAGKQEVLEQKLLLMSTALHAADISNPCKPLAIMLRWTRRVLEEFWVQGDEERRRGLAVSPLCDREAGMASVPKGQLS